MQLNAYYMSNFTIHYSLKTELIYNEISYDMTSVIRLLEEIQNHRNLRAAADSCHFSYRKAWDILKQFRIFFGADLVDTKQGKGSQLTTLGQAIIDNKKENNQLFSDQLSTASSKTNTSLQTALSLPETIRIIASDSEKLTRIRQLNKSITLQFDGSSQALTAYHQGLCEIAGFHISAKNNSQQLSNYCQKLNQKEDQFILLEKRVQGIISQFVQPVTSLKQIVDQQLIFVNRQIGSGTRQLIDRLFQEEGISSENIKGYYHEEHTHLAVASMICSGQAEAGVGIQNAAEHLNLHFSALNSEYYFLVFKTLSPSIRLILKQIFDQQIPIIMNYNSFIKFITKTKENHGH